MQRDYETELKNISRVSTILVAFFWVALGLIVLAFLYASVNTLSQPTSLGEHQMVSLNGLALSLTAEGGLTSRDKLLVMLISGGALCFAVPFLLLAIRLLNCFRNRQLFTEQSVRYARAIAWLYSIYLVLGVAVLLALPALLDLDRLTLGFSANPLIILAIVWMYAWIMQVGRALQFDSDMAI